MITIDTSIHLDGHARVTGVVRYHDDGRPYSVLKISGTHAYVTIFPRDEAVLRDLIVQARRALDALTAAHSANTTGGAA